MISIATARKGEIHDKVGRRRMDNKNRYAHRIVIEIPDETHKQLKQYVLDKNVSLRIVFMALIADFLGKVSKKCKSK